MMISSGQSWHWRAKLYYLLFDKTMNLSEIMKNYDHDFDLEVDGGVNGENAGEFKQVGANVLVAGSAIFNSDNYEKAIQDLRDA